LGYIVPWYDAMQMATGVYAFIEEPDVRQARKLMNVGGLWNTFIFGGTLSSLLELFRPKFEVTASALRAALQANPRDLTESGTLHAIYDRLTPSDFSQDLLAPQVDRLSVLRMPRCGWWPLKSPKRRAQFTHLAEASQDMGRGVGELQDFAGGAVRQQ
jgi:hypothetical protein